MRRPAADFLVPEPLPRRLLTPRIFADRERNWIAEAREREPELACGPETEATRAFEPLARLCSIWRRSVPSFPDVVLLGRATELLLESVRGLGSAVLAALRVGSAPLEC